jgi:hypothetical protein
MYVHFLMGNLFYFTCCYVCGVTFTADMSSFVREVPDEEVFPLAVFEVDWMTVAAAGGGAEQRQGEGQGHHHAASLMTIHVSLYQHVMESEDLELETNKVQRWLRVGYLLEHDCDCDSPPVGSEEKGGGEGGGERARGSSSSCSSCDNEGEGEGKEGSTLKILEFIPNAVAKCMGVREADWVDLDYVSDSVTDCVRDLQCLLPAACLALLPRLT